MKHRKKFTFILFLFACIAFTGSIAGQTPSDAIMMQQRESCFAAIYEHSWFDHYWEGDYLRTNGTIETVNRNVFMPMLAIGIVDRLNLIVSAPYVQTASTEPNGGKFEGAKGFQDLAFNLKGLIIDKHMGPGKLAFLTNVGYSFPISNYLSDYRPYSIGSGAAELSLRGILQYKLDNGIYTRGALAYLWRGYTEAERDYYYNNGSYYTSTMDVPNAWNYNVVAGIWMLNDALKIEANYTGLKSTSGDDIRPYNAAQPTNKVDFDRLGVSVQYYFNKPKGLGVLAYFTQTIAGRNVGKTSIYGVGLTYQFKV